MINDQPQFFSSAEIALLASLIWLCQWLHKKDQNTPSMQRQSWAFLGKKKKTKRAEISWRRAGTTDLIACCNFFSGVCVE
jgi:hypothetical protein